MATKLKDITDAVRAARAAAHREAKASNPWVRSRGTFLCTSDGGAQCAPRPEADCPVWSGKVGEILNLVGEVLAAYPAVESIYISGGYDGADTFRDLYEDDNYEPWVATWEVTLWTRADGWKLLPGLFV